MNSQITKFIIQLLLAIGVGFIIHIALLYITSHPIFDNKIILSYSVNAILAAVIFLGLYLAKEKFKNQIGFLFMGGSFLKFFVFFLVFMPIFKEDGTINKLEFASFFVPYAICLLMETLGVMRLLRN